MEMKGNDDFRNYHNFSGDLSNPWNGTERRNILITTTFEEITSHSLSSSSSSSSSSLSLSSSSPQPTSSSLPLTAPSSSSLSSPQTPPPAVLSLYELNREHVRVAIPSISVLSILMVIGFIGNIFVVVVFGFKMKKASTYRLFILILAMNDLTACIVGIPGLVLELEKPYTFYNGIACKLLRYGYHVIAMGTSVTHTLIAIDRYRRICKATSKQMSVRSARIISIVMFIAVLIVSLPMFVMNDSVPVQTRVYNVSGNCCGTTKEYADTVYPLLFNILLCLFVVVTVAILIVLYALIGHKVCNRSKFFRSLSNDKVGSYSTAKRSKAWGAGGVMFRNKVKPIDPASAACSKPEANANRKDLEVESVSMVSREFNRANMSSTTELEPSQSQRKQARLILSRKMTVTTFAIMVVYTVSYCPLMVLAMLRVISKHIMDDLTFTEEVFYTLGFHTYAINNMANPLVYIFMDIEFRRHCVNIFSALRCK